MTNSEVYIAGLVDTAKNIKHKINSGVKNLEGVLEICEILINKYKEIDDLEKGNCMEFKVR